MPPDHQHFGLHVIDLVLAPSFAGEEVLQARSLVKANVELNFRKFLVA